MLSDKKIQLGEIQHTVYDFITCKSDFVGYAPRLISHMRDVHHVIQTCWDLQDYNACTHHAMAAIDIDVSYNVNPDGSLMQKRLVH